MSDKNIMATRSYVRNTAGGGGIVGSYNELNDLPTLNGKVFQGDVLLELGIDEELAEEIARRIAGELVGNLSEVARTGSYGALTSKPRINGTELNGDVTLELSGGLTESQVQAIAQACVTQVIAQLPRVTRSGSYGDLSGKPQINGRTLEGNLDVGGDQLTVQQVKDAASQVVSTAMSALPAASRSGSYADLTGKPSINGVPLEGDVTIEGGGGLSLLDVETVVANSVKQAIDGLPIVAKTGEYYNLTSLPTINGRTLIGDVRVETEISQSQIELAVGSELDKRLAEIRSTIAEMKNDYRYRFVDLTASSGESKLHDRAMNRVGPGVFYPPDSVEGQARDFQVTALQIPSGSSVSVDLSGDTVFMDDVLADPVVTTEPGTSSVMFVFTEVAPKCWYVNKIYETVSGS